MDRRLKMRPFKRPCIEWRLIEALSNGVRYQKFIGGKPTNNFKLILDSGDPTLDLQVGASSDDCYRRLTTSYWSLTSSYQQAGAYDVTAYKVGGGMRFLDVTVPQGATIDTAYLTLRCRTATSGTVVRTRISAEKEDNPATFADNSATFDTRWANRTTARVDWDAIPAWSINTDYNSPEIKTVIKEIVDRAGWASGNAVVIFWEDFEDRSDKSAGCRREAYSRDGSATYAPKLHIEYTLPGAAAGRSRALIIG